MFQQTLISEQQLQESMQHATTKPDKDKDTDTETEKETTTKSSNNAV